MKCHNISQWRRYITVEPILFLYMFATFMYYPLLQNMVYSSYCDKDPTCSSGTSGGNTSISSCGQKSQVSAHTSHFIFYLTLSTILPGALATFLLGRWSDMSGRKLLMTLPAGGACANAIISVLTFEFKWSINILLAGGLVAGLMGSYAMFNQAAFAYVADVSSSGQRTRRLGVLEAMIYLGMTLGSEIGGVWTQRDGYGPPFWGVIVSLLAVLAYIAFFLDEVPISATARTTSLTLSSILHGFGLFFKPSPHRRTRLVVLFAFVFATINFNALIDVTIPYLRDQPFKWSFELIGHYLALGNLMHGIAAIAILPFLVRLGVTDMACIQIGIFSSMLSLVLLGLARVTWLVFMGKESNCAQLFWLLLYLIAYCLSLHEELHLYPSTVACQRKCSFWSF